jgi:hypothetical protein
MTRTGTVNYHVHKPERQAFEIDAGGVVGRLISPDLVATLVAVNDVRSGGARVAFEKDGVAFANAPSAADDFSGSDWQKTYDAELAKLLTSQLGAKEVVIFDRTLREDNPSSARKPARNVHSDYSVEGAQRRLVC